ncbi:MAG: sulfurtransferase complex subunit TusD [Ectothiorhodospiraceae bacterium]|nr:sulfurtransferase complex subunit TusD [Chromatiales bacterium]MCP5157473.1 sulfurtransferase complex subunit TusD [Ectothiorhodospiraceae bacterium]
MVLSGPYQHQSADTALRFVRAALARGHRVSRVFFYADGVHVANRLAVVPADDRDLQRAWSTLASEHGVDLAVCVAAALRRGVIDAAEAARHGRDADNLAPGFRITGLGALAEMVRDADRVVVLGGGG